MIDNKKSLKLEKFKKTLKKYCEKIGNALLFVFIIGLFSITHSLVMQAFINDMLPTLILCCPEIQTIIEGLKYLIPPALRSIAWLYTYASSMLAIGWYGESSRLKLQSRDENYNANLEKHEKKFRDIPRMAVGAGISITIAWVVAPSMLLKDLSAGFVISVGELVVPKIPRVLTSAYDAYSGKNKEKDRVKLLESVTPLSSKHSNTELRLSA